MSVAERTEAATPRRRQLARERGEVARSAELVGAAVLVVGLLGLRWLGVGVADRLAGFTRTVFALAATRDLGPADAQSLGLQVLVTTLLTTAPLLLLVLLVAVAANVAQVGFLLTGQPLMPQLQRLNPISGFQRLFSRRSALELLKALVKFGIVGYVGYRFLVGHQAELAQLAAMSAARISATIGELARAMALQMAAAYCVLAGLDYGYQRFQYEVNLRMTRQELRDDLKQTEGDPRWRSWRRQRHRELGRRRMMADVAQATVVIANPRHYAVALRYRAGETDAPRVLAKGQGYVALRIRAVAEEHGVPVVENPPLARALFGAVEVGQEIPASFYRAVAEVLALVYRAEQAVRRRPATR